MTKGSVTAPWSDRLELGEGARWMGGDRVVLVDLLRGRLLAADASHASLRMLAELDVPVGAVAPIQAAASTDEPPTWIAAAGTGIRILSPATDPPYAIDIPPMASASPNSAADIRVNDATADAAGRFWFGTMAYDGTQDAGSLYRVDRDGTVTQVLDGISVPNGPAFSRDGATMYLADSARGLVRRYSVSSESGELSESEIFVDFADLGDGAGGPDGMTVDCAGGLWIACWGGAAVRRFLPDGTPDRVIELPAAQPASVCLGGPDGRLLHITTARYGLHEPREFDGAVLTVPVEVPGFPAAAYRMEVDRCQMEEDR